MTPKKKARIGQRANVTPGVEVDRIFDDAGEHPRGEDVPPVTTMPDSTTANQTTPVPTLLKVQRFLQLIFQFHLHLQVPVCTGT